MRLQLIPREERFFDMFVEHAANVLGAARLLDAMLRSYDEIETRAAEIREARRRGVDIRRDIYQRIEATFVPPFEQADVRALVRSLDEVMHGIDETADTFVTYGIDAPTAAAIDLAAIVVRQCEQLHEALTQLSGFRGLEANQREIRRLEADGVRLSREAIVSLFDGVEPLEAIKWWKVYQTLEATVDRCVDAADVIERITLRNA